MYERLRLPVRKRRLPQPLRHPPQTAEGNYVNSPLSRPSAVFVAATAGALLLRAGVCDASSIDQAKLDELTRAVEPKVIEWRRDIHRHPELSNRETRTAKLVAEHLKKLGLEVRTGIAHTGVSAYLKGGLPGPTIALRADMDALPVTEKTDVPFKSVVTSQYRGQTVGVMHACGHDMHTAVLMGVAQTLSAMRASLPGNVLFIFQPAEEGAPEGEEGGASLMLKEGLFDKYPPKVAFGMHAWSMLASGEIGVRAGPIMAASDSWRIEVLGRQAHGSRPWQGIDPIVTAAQIVNGLQTIVSREVDLTLNPAVLTVGAINAGIRHNIIPDRAEMIGTLRTFDVKQREKILAGIDRVVQNVAAANGATATFKVDSDGNPVNFNDPELLEKMVPTLMRVAGQDKMRLMTLITGAEDFAWYAQKVPSVFFFVGVTPPGQDPATAPGNHSDYFYVDEASIPVALRAMTQMAVDYLAQPQ
jgi:amidohydrolase